MICCGDVVLSSREKCVLNWTDEVCSSCAFPTWYTTRHAHCMPFPCLQHCNFHLQAYSTQTPHEIRLLKRTLSNPVRGPSRLYAVRISDIQKWIYPRWNFNICTLNDENRLNTCQSAWNSPHLLAAVSIRYHLSILSIHISEML